MRHYSLGERYLLFLFRFLFLVLTYSGDCWFLVFGILFWQLNVFPSSVAINAKEGDCWYYECVALIFSLMSTLILLEIYIVDLALWLYWFTVESTHCAHRQVQ